MHWPDRNVAVATQRVRQRVAASVAAEPKRVRAVKLAAAPRPVVEMRAQPRADVEGIRGAGPGWPGLSNKAIARIIDASGETVRWHLKNFFRKLSATIRKHAVDRARLLGRPRIAFGLPGMQGRTDAVQINGLWVTRGLLCMPRRAPGVDLTASSHNYCLVFRPPAGVRTKVARGIPAGRACDMSTTIFHR